MTMQKRYSQQVALVIETIPYINRERCFALKGGTAINLFYRNMPRLSVDIDLTYLSFDDRKAAYVNISEALGRIADSLAKVKIHSVFQGSEDRKKMIVSKNGVSIKIEPNYTIRGKIFETEVLSICKKGELSHGYAEIQVVSLPELYGGKMCAALDRQHPRDLFDIKYLLDSNDNIDKLFLGFIAMLLAHNRPIHELIAPVIKDQEEAFKKEFQGMTHEPFSYNDHTSTMKIFLDYIHAGLKEYKTFLLDFFSLNLPASPIPNLYRLPAILWKRENLERLKKTNPLKFAEQLNALKQAFH